MHETVGKTRLRIKIGKIGMLGALYREKNTGMLGALLEEEDGKMRARPRAGLYLRNVQNWHAQTTFGRDRQNVHPTIARVDL